MPSPFRHPGFNPGPSFFFSFWKPWVPAFAGMTMLWASPASAQPAAIDYGKAANWLCLPGQNDICARPLPTPSGFTGTKTTSPRP